MSNFLIAPSQDFDSAERLRPDNFTGQTILGGFALEHGRMAHGFGDAAGDASLQETARDADEALQPRSGRRPSCHVDQCRRLTARCYVKEGYVTERDLNDQGYLNDLTDPYVSDSEYFWKTNKAGDVVATLRIIHPPEDGAPLPIEKSFNLFSAQQSELDEMRRTKPASVVEISALAKSEGANSRAGLDMYKAVWQHAKRTHIELCAISADMRLHGMLVEAFGAAIDPAGEPSDLMGSQTVPSLLHPDRCAEALAAVYREKVEAGKFAAASYKKLVAYLLDGLDASYLSDGERTAIESIGLTIAVES